MKVKLSTETLLIIAVFMGILANVIAIGASGLLNGWGSFLLPFLMATAFILVLSFLYKTENLANYILRLYNRVEQVRREGLSIRRLLVLTMEQSMQEMHSDRIVFLPIVILLFLIALLLDSQAGSMLNDLMEKIAQLLRGR